MVSTRSAPAVAPSRRAIVNSTDDREPLDQLKARVDLLEMVRRYVKLDRAGPGAFVARCPFHEDSTPSFRLRPARQRYRCYGCGAKGDVLDFLAAIEGVSLADAIRRLRDLAGAPGRCNRPIGRWAPEPERPDRNGELAREIWRQTESIPAGPGRDYLIDRRGIPAWDDDRVRWHPACPWGPDRIGCIVAPVVSHLTGHTVAIWRIRPAMHGKVERRGLGPMHRNCSPTWQPEGDELAVSEGIEDALAVKSVTGLPCWAALSAGNMEVVSGIPPWVRRVTVFADADDQGRRSAHILAQRLRDAGRLAKVVRAALGKDPNDVLLAGAS